jgi:hypothetical protein
MSFDIVEYNDAPPAVQHLQGCTLLCVLHPEQVPDAPVRAYQLAYPGQLSDDQAVAKLADMQRAVRNGLVAEQEWRVQRYEQQRHLQHEQEDAGVYLDVLRYLQELRDISQQPNFPLEVTWPCKP